MTAIQERDPITLAIEAFDKVYKITGANAKGLRSRLRTLPALVQEAGLVTTLLFYASKSQEVTAVKSKNKNEIEFVMSCIPGLSMDDLKKSYIRVSSDEFNIIINYLLFELEKEEKYKTIKIKVQIGKNENEMEADIKCLTEKIPEIKEKTGKEGGGYGTALALTLYGLIKICPQVKDRIENICVERKKNNRNNNTQSNPSENNIEITIECLLSLLKDLRVNGINGCNELKAMAVLEDYFLTLKRLAEALIGD